MTKECLGTEALGLAVDSHRHACSSRSPESTDTSFRFSVATYNVHQWIGADGRRDPARCARVIRELKADFVGLQEVTYRAFGRDGFAKEHLAGYTGLNVVSGPTIRADAGRFGNVLLTRHPVHKVGRLDLTVRDWQPRSALDVEVDVSGVPVRIVVTHLGLLESHRRAQVARLLDLISPDPSMLVVMMGDFNLWFPKSPLLVDIEKHFGRSPSLRTYPAHFPLLRLDRIWVSPREALVEIRVHKTLTARLASDHLPIKAVIRALGQGNGSAMA